MEVNGSAGVSGWALRAGGGGGDGGGRGGSGLGVQDAEQPEANGCGGAVRRSYCKWIKDAERDLVGIMGEGGDGAEKLKGRGCGPKFVWTPALGSVAAKEAGTTAAAREWRNVKAWALALRRAAIERGTVGSVSTGVAAEAAAASRRLGALIAVHRSWLQRSPQYRDPSVDVGPRTTAVEVYKAANSPEVLEQLAAAADANAKGIENAEVTKRLNAWKQWLRGGAGDGLSRQHRFVRTVQGWVQAKVGCKPAVMLSSMDDCGALSPPECRRICTAEVGAERPLDRQEIAEKEAEEWAELWAAHGEVDPPTWPSDLGPMLARPSVARLRAALRSFPKGTGLSWDALHPRALLRLSDERLEQLISVLMDAEREGAWPPEMAFVAIVLLPKEGGGHRPVGLFPCLVRVWMRLRRGDVEEWELRNERSHCYTGAGKGARVATWKQAARGELAAATGASYAQLLLDLAKAFEVVDHAVLTREAIAVGFPLPLLRLSLAAYRLPRALVLDGCYSSIVDPLRGITAGSGTATVELKVMLMRLLDRIEADHPSVRVTSYVDDVSCEVTGTQASVVRTLSLAGDQLCDGLVALKLRLSTDGKCLFTSTSYAVGDQVAGRLKRFGVVFAARVKSLGVGLGGGARRNAAVQESRLKKFVKRVHKLAALVKARLSAALVARTGGTAVMNFGDECVGVSDDLLLRRRRAVLAAVSPRNKGRDLDMALAMMEESGKQRLDPAFEACAAPLVRWAEAVWSDWIPAAAMEGGVAKAKTKLAAARRPWAAVTGPAGAVVATAARIGWKIDDAATMVTDEGVLLSLRVDPPAVIKKEVYAAVRRWRWARVVAKHPQLAVGDANGEGALEPLRKLLRPASRARHWSAAQQSALRSVLTNGQWPQARLAKAALVEDPYCQLCAACGAHPGVIPPMGTAAHRSLGCGVALAVAKGALGVAWPHFRRGRKMACDLLGQPKFNGDDDPTALCSLKAQRCAVASQSRCATDHLATDERRDVDMRPTDAAQADGGGGDTILGGAEVDVDEDGHGDVRAGAGGAARRIGWGLRQGWQRAMRRGSELCKGAADAIIASSVEKAWSRAGHGLAWTSGLVTLPTPLVPCHGIDRSNDGTFNWVKRPADGFPLATFYTDGSLLDGELGIRASVAWAFVAVDASGAVLAEANGRAPSWVRCISGAEAWALRMAALSACPGSSFVTDSLNCVKAVRKGRMAARSPKNALARSWLSLLSVFDDGDGDDAGAAASLAWMPAHTSEADIGHCKRSDGLPVSLTDWTANRRADQLAKQVAYSNRAPLAFRAELLAMQDVILHVGRHLGWTTWAANNAPMPPFRDATSLSAAQKAERAARRANGVERNPKRTRVLHVRTPVLGGHVLARQGDMWRCCVCWKGASDRAPLAAQKCTGAVTDRWAQMEEDAIGGCEADARRHSRHARWTTDGIVWCAACGSYAESRARGLTLECAGPPPASGRRCTTAPNSLRQGKCPNAGAQLCGRAVPEHGRHDASGPSHGQRSQRHRQQRQRQWQRAGDGGVPWGTKDPGVHAVESCSGDVTTRSSCAGNDADLASPTPAGMRLAAIRERIRTKGERQSFSSTSADTDLVCAAVDLGGNGQLRGGAASASAAADCSPPPPKRLRSELVDDVAVVHDNSVLDAMGRGVETGGGGKRFGESFYSTVDEGCNERAVRRKLCSVGIAEGLSSVAVGTRRHLVQSLLGTSGHQCTGGAHWHDLETVPKRRRTSG